MLAAAYLRVLAAAVCCYAALGAVLRVLPGRLERLGAGAVAIGLAVGAPALAGVLFRPLGGRLADRRGPRRVLAAGTAAMAAGVLPALAASAPAQVLSRLLVGAGEGLMMSAAVLWLLRLAGEGRQGRTLGHIGLANYGGLALGPLTADAVAGADHPGRVLALAAALPLAGAALLPRAAPRSAGRSPRAGDRAPSLLAAGAGLLLVNVGYVTLLSFGPAAVSAQGAGGAQLVVPVFAATVIAVRTAGGAVPDRLGARRTLLLAAPAAAAGLAGVAAAPSAAAVLAAVAVLAAGQALAVPALGLLALAGVPAAHRGAAAGAFFAFFDVGVGAGGLAAGVLARLAGAAGALAGAAVAVALVAAVGLHAAPSDSRA